VVADYAEDSSPQQLKAMFPGCRDLAVRPLTLRSIFINLAKSYRSDGSWEAP